MVATATLKLKPEVIAAQKVKELLQMTIPSVDYSQGYSIQARPTLRTNLMMGASSTSKTKDRDRYISQNITELLRRTIVD